MGSVRSISVLAGFVLLGFSGCGTSSANAPGSTPAATARAYVDAINAHDGKTICGLMVDSAADEFRTPQITCPKFVSAYIGYGEESDTDTFARARLLDVDEGKSSGALRSVKMRVELQLNDQGNESRRIKKTFDDVLWLVERDGGWRLAKASGVLYAAFAAYNVPDDLFAAPNLAARDRDYNGKIAKERDKEKAERATFHEPEDRVFNCGGTRSAYEDANLDLHIEGEGELSPEEARRYGAADIRRVEVDTAGDDLCARFTLRSDLIRERLLLRFDIYSPKKNPTYLGPELKLNVDVRSDGRARLAYEDTSREEDEYGRYPVVAVPGRIGRSGSTFSFRVARNELLTATHGRALPPWSGFLWGGVSFYLVTRNGDRRAISDDIHAYLAMVSHPGGKVYESGERQRRTLPTH
jgi:hypothetical protein